MQEKKLHKSAIALLITVFFIMLITVSMGIGLKYVKNSSSSMQNESFMFQSSVVVEDFLQILKNSPDLALVKDTESLAVFLAQSSFLPFQSGDLNVIVKIRSARSKLYPIIFKEEQRGQALNTFLVLNAIQSDFGAMLYDSTNGIKEDNTYQTDIFNENPSLFREYISSDAHLQKLIQIYTNKYHDNNLEKMQLENLFSVGQENNSSIDLNYATPLAWQLMLACDAERANTLSENGFGVYKDKSSLGLSIDEETSLSKFKNSFFEPIVEVKITITKEDKNAFIRFEYNILLKKGSHFVFNV